MLKKIKFSSENITLSALSVILALNSLLFLNLKTSSGYYLSSTTPKLYYLLYLILFSTILLTIQKHSKKFNWKNCLTKIILTTLLSEIVFLNTFRFIDPQFTPIHWSFHFLVTAWLFIATFLILVKLEKKLKINISFFDEKFNLKKWIEKQGRFYLGILGVVMILSLGFGSYNIEKAALVDEALWTFERIPSFWQNIEEQDLYNTRVSDKPGVTTAIISGASLLVIDNPEEYDSEQNYVPLVKTKELNFIFRLPALILAILMLPILYFFMEKLIGKKASIFSIILIGLSPILIGMSRMINPDALLWIFTTLSLLSFLSFLEKKNNSAIVWSGFFLGLSLLTKYVSGFLYVFFLGLIFIKYILKKPSTKNTNLFFKKNLFSYLILIFVSLVTFFILYPGTWVKPERILMGTFLSQAFNPFLPYFSVFLVASLLDTFFLKNIFLKNILSFLSNQKRKLVWATSAIFLLFLGIVFWNIYAKNTLFDLSEILSSPKSSYRSTNPLWFMATNFYPLIFGISPIALFFVIYFLIKSFRKKIIKTLGFRISFYLIIFILLYYMGSAFSNVSATIRYQIMLYPLILIISGIWISCFINKFKSTTNLPKYLAFLLIFTSSLTLFHLKPFYFSYASKLLPQKYHIDYKDMGLGSYEAAMHLNILPDAKEISIWSDKIGVCTFFLGKCYSKFDKSILEGKTFDYYVISSGRKNLTTNKMNLLLRNYPDAPRIDTLYTKEDNASVIINLANRKSNYIKIFKGDSI